MRQEAKNFDLMLLVGIRSHDDSLPPPPEAPPAWASLLIKNVDLLLSGVASLTADVASLKADVASLKADAATSAVRMQRIEGDLNTMRGAQIDMRNQMSAGLATIRSDMCVKQYGAFRTSMSCTSEARAMR